MAKKRKSVMPKVDKSRCDNCQKVTSDEDLNSINDIYERVDPGGVMPSGECPHCGCLAYPIVRKKQQRCIVLQDNDADVLGVYLIPPWMKTPDAREKFSNGLTAIQQGIWTYEQMDKEIKASGFELLKFAEVFDRT
jgi:hypothetical protein